MKTLTVSIKGMHCASCAGKIEKALQQNPKVETARVNFANQKAQVKSELSLDEIKSLVSKLGYQVVTGIQELSNETEVLQKKKELLAALVLGALVFGLSFIEHLISGIAQAVLTSAIVFYPGRHFFISAWKQARQISVNMDTLMALGVGAAYVYSIAALFIDEPLYFETAAMICAFVLIGNYLETRAKNQANLALQKLMEFSPQVGRVIENNKERILKISEILVGTHILVKPGEKIPLDGMVEDGSSFVDESAITGESKPVQKEKGLPVFGASMNGEGALYIKVTKKDTDTLFAKVIQLVEEAQNSKAPVQKLADTISSYFVPIVCLIAIVTFIGWFDEGLALALKYSVAVFVVACPCALGLATPIAVITATGRGAKEGILIKNANTLQKLASINVVLFDKTGTLTEGKPAITEFINFGEKDDKAIIQLAASGEAKSEHPLAHAFTRYAEDLRIAVLKTNQFKAIKGGGIVFEINDQKTVLGSETLLKDHGISLDVAQNKIQDLNKLAYSVSFMAIDGKLEALFFISDKIREKAAAAIQKIKHYGIKPLMLTGDNSAAATVVANKVGISEVLANLKPDEKLEKLKALQRENYKVAMIGDGINDAPALAAADVGIALEGGTDIALETSDITLLKGDISKVADVLLLGQKSFRIIKQNLFWAFFYNVVAIPAAVFGYLHPMIAAAAMSLSSLTVVLNALRIRRN
ncbi:MAG TPA: heavy metal translocating P-type ATPase [Bdellovibrionota bacterium]|nr:heavy metal translocating P-type ATPase [Bdellovibrionota bacterium]